MPRARKVIMKTKYEIGDQCWIAIGAPPLWEGEVMASFTTPKHTAEFYIINVKHPDYPQMEVRDALLMSETAEGPLPFMMGPEFTLDENGDAVCPAFIDAAALMALVENREGARLDTEHDGLH